MAQNSLDGSLQDNVLAAQHVAGIHRHFEGGLHTHALQEKRPIRVDFTPGGELQFDTGKPDGTPRKVMDVSRMTWLGWRCRRDLADGVRATYQWYCAQP